MDYEELRFLLSNNKATALIKADNASLIISFAIKYFKQQNRISIPSAELTTNLSDYLYHVRSLHEGEGIYPNTPGEYLERWATQGYLRRYYPPDNDEPLFELTPAAERVIEWMRELNKKEFVGTESRLLLIFNLLADLVMKASADPVARLKVLGDQREQIEREISDIESGRLASLTPTQIRERFAYVDDTLRRLLSDFRQLEEDFRKLDHEIRKQQISATAKKGKVLDEIFKVTDAMWDTDQGRSFRAFRQLLVSQEKLEELKALVDAVCQLPSIGEAWHHIPLRRLFTVLAEEGEKVYRTNHNLIEQLRRFIDDRVYLENARVMEIIRGIKEVALAVKDSPPPVREEFFAIEDCAAIEMVMDRPLFAQVPSLKLTADLFDYGDDGLPDEASLAALFVSKHIDITKLEERIDRMLENLSQVSLRDILASYPAEHGIAEVVGYLTIASRNGRGLIDESVREWAFVENKETGKGFDIHMPRVIFAK